MSKQSFRFASEFLLRPKDMLQTFPIDRVTLSKDLSPYLHHLSFRTGHRRYSAPFAASLVEQRKRTPNAPLITFTRDVYSQGPEAAALTIHVEEAYEAALAEQTITHGGQSLIRASGLTAILGVSYQTVSDWSGHGVLPSVTLPDKPYTYFAEEQVRSFVQWHRPISMLDL